MTHALKMQGEGGIIEPRYSDKDRTMLLYAAVRTVMFAIMMWPGAEQMYCRGIEQRMERITKLRRMWEDNMLV